MILEIINEKCCWCGQRWEITAHYRKGEEHTEAKLEDEKKKIKLHKTICMQITAQKNMAEKLKELFNCLKPEKE